MRSTRFLLASLGIGVVLAIGAGELTDGRLGCAAEGCRKATASVFGHVGPVPTYAVGFVFYVTALLLAAWSSKWARRLEGVLLPVAFVISVGLTAYAAFHLRTFCVGCSLSCLIVCSMLVSWAFEKGSQEGSLRWTGGFAAIVGGFCVASALSGLVPRSDASTLSGLRWDELAPLARSSGPHDDLIAWIDVTCVGCREDTLLMCSKGKRPWLRFVSIAGHEGGEDGERYGRAAELRGRLPAFLTALSAGGHVGRAELRRAFETTVVSKNPLTSEEWQRALEDVREDQRMAIKINLDRTPAYIVLRANGPAFVSRDEMMNMLLNGVHVRRAP